MYSAVCDSLFEDGYRGLSKHGYGALIGDRQSNLIAHGYRELNPNR
jgi:hypothetical protein